MIFRKRSGAPKCKHEHYTTVTATFGYCRAYRDACRKHRPYSVVMEVCLTCWAARTAAFDAVSQTIRSGWEWRIKVTP